MSRTALLARVSFVLFVLCGVLVLFNPPLQTAVSAAAFPTGENNSAATNNGWVINEFHADPASDLSGDANGDGIRDAGHDEFIELFNDTGAAADISGWTLADSVDKRHTFPPGSLVPDQCTIVVFGGGVPVGAFGNAVVQVASSGSLSLNNSGDSIALIDNTAAVASVAYGFEGNEDQALTRDPDVDGEFARHLLASGSRFSPGTRLDGTMFQGCPGYDAPPLVLETQPPDGASDVAIDSALFITFSEPVTVNPPWFEISCAQSGGHTAVPTGDEAAYTVAPDSPFAYGETCQVTLFGAAISDQDGEPHTMESDVQWAFTTEEEPDEAPLVVASFPAEGANGVAGEATLSITFSEAVVLAETAVNLTCSLSGSVGLTLSGGPAQFQAQPQTDLAAGEQCTLSVAAEGVSDADDNDPPDHMANGWQINFSIASTDFVLINEVNAAAGPLEDSEFIELFDGGLGETPLDGLSLVLFNGQDDRAYATIDLAGQHTDVDGYFLLGNSSVSGVDLVFPDSLLQNGADAVALYGVKAAEIPVGTAVTTENLLDAVVYDNGQSDDAGLLPLLLPGEAQVTEDARSLADFHSLQRCPDGSGGPRQTGTYWPDLPTPNQANTCVKDEGPQIVAATPSDGAINIPLDSEITITFSEEVIVSGTWFDLTCEYSGNHAATVSGGGSQYSLHTTAPFSSGELCQVTILAEGVRDLDSADPPDHLPADVTWSFRTIPAWQILINEVDADTVGADTAEFIELYDGGSGNTSLDGLVLVMFNGASDLSYRAVDLSGHQTDAQGRFVAGGSAVPNVDLALPDGSLQNGPDAVALYTGKAADYPNGSPVSTDSLLDALVYGDAGEPDGGLLVLLVGGEEQLDEDGRGNAQADSLQRCPDGSGEQRHSAAFLPNLATPGIANKCSFDTAPEVITMSPASGENDVALDAPLSITFSESVDLDEDWLSLTCEKGGSISLSVQHMEELVTLKPQSDLLNNDACTVTVSGERVHDSDVDDPPDTLAGDFTWSFETVSIPVARHILINEVDADTAGEDTAEFIELYDGGGGNTALDGLVLVLFNGSDYRSYKSIDLDGYQMDAQGYFVLGNAAVPGADYQLSNGAVQNGPDAVALYAGEAADFPTGTAVTADDLLDALVYSTGVEEAPRLMRLLRKDEGIVDEDGFGFKDSHSNQRCPNGGGGQRRTAAYLQNRPTPKEANLCLIDEAPGISGHAPSAGAEDVAVDAVITIIFSETVSLAGDGVKLQCDKSGDHELALSGGPDSFTIRPQEILSPGETCTVTVFAEGAADLDRNDPPDNMAGDYTWSFETASPPLARHVVINEVDADTPGADTAEFIELYDGGQGNTSLDGLEVVLINGATDGVYRRIDLASYQTNAEGYFVIGGTTVPGVDLAVGRGAIQNGPDAVALYAAGDSGDGNVGEKGLLDALVYHTNDEADDGLDFLLLKNEPQVNEGQTRDAALDSNQRCPNGQGGQRITSGFVQNQPTPGAANNCTVDTPPMVVKVFPENGAQGVALNAALVVQFDEPVQPADGWIALACEQTGEIDLAITGGPQQYVIQPASLPPLDTCTVVVVGDKVYDLDGYIDALGDDFSWQFSTGEAPTSVSAGFTSSSPAVIREPVQFFNTSQGPGPLSFEWDFGDNSPLVSEENPQHLYMAVGTYMVTLTVKTAAGETAVASSAVEILPVRIFVPLTTSQ